MTILEKYGLSFLVSPTTCSVMCHCEQRVGAKAQPDDRLRDASRGPKLRLDCLSQVAPSH